MSDEPLTFTRGSHSQTVTITIIDDTAEEISEKFVARLSVNAALYPGVRLSPDTANVIIVPNGKTMQNHTCVVDVYMVGRSIGDHLFVFSVRLLTELYS